MRRRQLGLALFSAALLVAEISLTRFYSARYYPPIVFAILSLALLGIGGGAAIAAWSPAARRTRLLAVYPGALGLTLCATVLLLTSGAGQVVEALGWGLLVLGFVFAGMTLAALYAGRHTESPALYWADLTGAGLGAVLAAPLLDQLGVIHLLFLAGLFAAVAGLFFVPSLSGGSQRVMPLAAGIIAGGLLASNVLTGWIDLEMGRLPTEKPIRSRLANGGQVLHTQWDSFARTDLIDPGGGAPYELYMDGAAGSVMPPADGHPALWQDIGLFPFATEQPRQVFIIGAGAGLDIWFALQGRAREITAVEVNRASLRALEQYGAYNGALADRPEVRLVVDDGRSLLEREDRRYDLISLAQVVTAAAERDGYALVENDAYTVEAIETYLAHLNDGGIVALKLYDEITLIRATTTALAALARSGVDETEAMLHLLALADPGADPPVPLLLIRNRPFSREDALTLGAVANDVGFVPYYLPHVWAEPPFDELSSGAHSLAQFVATAADDISPTSDDRPFFFQFERGVPGNLRQLLMGIGVVALAMLLVALRSGFGARSAERDSVRGWIAGAYALYFALLGSGFIAAEVALIQQVRLYVGHPTIAIAAVLGVLLIGGGIGSAVMGRQARLSHTAGLPIWPGGAVCLAMVVWALFWPPIAANTAAAPQTARVAIVLVSLLPLAFCMGIPFPLGLRAVGHWGERPVALAWAINGVMSVFGSVAAIALATAGGFWVVYLSAAGVYLCVVAAAAWVNSNQPR